jgi:peptidoglycan hydrolase-like protein with peptidoglycan-binding domain
MLNNPDVRRVLFLKNADLQVLDQLNQVLAGQAVLAMGATGENTIRAIQRLLITLGYSTASAGGYLIDGDYGRGTNRGVAQFQAEAGLASVSVRKSLGYHCTFLSARGNIVAIPVVSLDKQTLVAMLSSLSNKLASNEVAMGSVEGALFHLNALDKRINLGAAQIVKRYKKHAINAAAEQAAAGHHINIAWILAIIKKETNGVVRPRFEQHHFSRFLAKAEGQSLAEWRLRATSFGLGQIMGFNFKLVGEHSAMSLVSAVEAEQVAYVARFLGRKSFKQVPAENNPTKADCRVVAKAYNGAKYEKNHYHTQLENHFNEFASLL